MRLFKPCSRDQLRVRRHVALIALIALLAALGALLALPFVGGEHSASILSAMSINLGIILTALAGITAAWFHAAYRADERDKPAGGADG
jgi:cytosine/uracil/thiamine/allantoin permease